VGGGIITVLALAVVFVAVQIWNSRRLPEPPMAALPRQRELVVVPNAGAIAAQRRLDSLAAAATVAAESASAATVARDTTSVATATPAAPETAAAPPASGAAQPTAPDNTPAAPAPAPGAPIPSEIRIAAQSRFDSLADSLEHGLHNYHDRRVDFGQKRLSCKELAYGYRAAEEALVGLARLAGDTRALDPQRKSRYTALIAGMDTVNDDFDASKCKRL
jgi:hypothetical protein